jgi:hypothetical protein
MRVHARHALTVAFLSLATVCHAQIAGKVDLETAEAAAGLIGTPVFAIDGTEVGMVADVLLDGEGRATRLRLEAGSRLGIGTRRLEVPQGAFLIFHGRVVLELPTDAVQALPELVDASDEKE